MKYCILLAFLLPIGAFAQINQPPFPVRILDASQIFSSYRWQLDIRSRDAVIETLGDSLWQVIAEKTQENYWPEGFRQLTKKYGQKFLQKFPDILKPPPEKLKETRINHDDIRYFPIYSKQKHAYQADLTFYKVAVKDGYYINRPILCLININTRFAAAWPLEYTLKSKEDVDADWEPDETRERGKKRKISSADTSEPPSLKLLKQVQTKTSANTLKALLSCLIYLYHHGNQVDVVRVS